MSLTANISPEEGFLYVHVTGTFLLEDSKDIVTRIFDSLTINPCGKVLVDFREATGEPGMLERFLHAMHLVGELNFHCPAVSRSTRFAYLGKRPMVDPNRFGESVAISNGVAAKVTEDPEEALIWLGLPPARLPANIAATMVAKIESEE